MPLARTVSSGRSSRRACNALLVTGRGAARSRCGGVEQRRRWCRRGVAFATSAEIEQGRTQGSVEIIDDGHVGSWSATAARTASRSSAVTSSLLEMITRSAGSSCRSRSGGCAHRQVAPGSSWRRPEQPHHRDGTHPLGPRHDLCGVSDAAELNHHVIRWRGSAAHVGKRGAEALGDGATHIRR